MEKFLIVAHYSRFFLQFEQSNELVELMRRESLEEIHCQTPDGRGTGPAGGKTV